MLTVLTQHTVCIYACQQGQSIHTQAELPSLADVLHDVFACKPERQQRDCLHSDLAEGLQGKLVHAVTACISCTYLVRLHSRLTCIG